MKQKQKSGPWAVHTIDLNCTFLVTPVRTTQPRDIPWSNKKDQLFALGFQCSRLAVSFAKLKLLDKATAN